MYERTMASPCSLFPSEADFVLISCCCCLFFFFFFFFGGGGGGGLERGGGCRYFDSGILGKRRGM